MNKYLEQLVELSTIDKDIDDFTPRLEKVQSVLRATKDEQAAILAQIEEAATSVTELKNQKSQTNAHIAEFSAKIKDVAKKSGAGKTEKEIKALQLEDELAKEQLEAEVERLEKIIDSKNALKSELEAKAAELGENLTKIESEISAEVGAIERQRDEIYAKKNKLVGEMNQKILTFYEKIRKWAHNTAVVPVKKQACYGCFMQINDKTYSAVIKGEDIVTCPHCGRILYKEAAN